MRNHEQLCIGRYSPGSALLFAVLLLSAGGMILFFAEGRENEMDPVVQNLSEKGTLPPIDRSRPAQIETATFALG